MGSLIATGLRSKIITLDESLKEFRTEISVYRDSPAMIAFIQAEAINRLEQLITDDMMASVMKLMNSPLGFKTDKKEGPYYSIGDVKRCVIVALLGGFRLVGNEFNIIAGNFYATKEGIERAVREFPGVSDVRIQIGVPRTVSDKGALVECTASWKRDGVRDEIVCADRSADKDGIDSRIPVKVNSGMGPDAIAGKAKRKLYARMFERLNGTSVQTSEDFTDALDAEFEPSDKPDDRTEEQPVAPKATDQPTTATSAKQPRPDAELLTEFCTRLAAATSQIECQNLRREYTFADEDTAIEADARVMERKVAIKGR